jgi:DNA repair protein RecN (Recombination protein N)
MLQQLHIHNYAIIDSLEIRFSNHLTIITGETGAGKSILMGALSLILGERADTSVLLDKQKKCFIEGSFETYASPVKDFLLKNDLDAGDQILIRREIAANGKSRAFINDTPVTLVQLKQLTSLLVDLHQQFDTLELNNEDFQRQALDALAGNGKLTEDYTEVYKNYRSVVKELQKLTSEQALANRELDYNQFLFDELQDAGFSENELENIEAEIRLMSHAEQIKSTLSEIYFQMEEGEAPIVQEIKSISNKLQSLSRLVPDLEKLYERLHSLQIELQDISGEIDDINQQTHYDAEKINQLNERMTKGYGLLKKHNVTTTAELLQIQKRLEAELQKVTNLSDAINEKEKESLRYHGEAMKIAAAISANRKKAIKVFEEKVNTLLTSVGMPNARLKVDLQPSETLQSFGIDTIEFLFNGNVSAAQNKTARFEPLKKVASGGELSRLMLSIKSLVAKSIQLPTLIFDEIDSGISGEAARQVGMIIKELSAGHQVISITHQPQIAAKAHTHLFVYKELRDGQVMTTVKTLDAEERIAEIATMLSGKKPTAAAVENAKELMAGN